MKIIKISDLIIKKFHPIFHDTKHTHHIITSGRSGSKSSYMGIKGINTITSSKPGSVVVLRKFHNKLKKTVFKECLRAINRLGYSKKQFKITVSPMQITFKKTGNTIYFTGNDSIDDTKGMIDEDRPIILVLIDEVTEFFDKGDGEDELQNIEATFIRGDNEEFVMEYYYNPPKNPKAPIQEWCEKMEKRPDVIHVHVDYRDLPISWVGKKLIESAEILKNIDEKMYNWLWLGLCTGIDELIYYMFNEKKHVRECTEEDYKNMNYCYISVDYGQMNATTYECFGIDYKNKCVRGIDEYYYSGREVGRQKSPSEYALDFKNFINRIKEETGLIVRYVFIDPSAKGLAEEIKKQCPEIIIRDAKNDVALGISRVQKLLSLCSLFISPRQKNLIKEMYLYEYDKDQLDKGKEIPIKKNDHCMDALRYLVMGIWKLIRQIIPILQSLEKGDDND